MSNETLRSLIVTDPSLVDESIDVSGLRTQTDTNPRLLASIADYPGISYDPTSFSYLSDLNELFGYGLPLAEEGKVLPPAIGKPETGGGSQVTVPGGVNTLVTPKNTAEEQRLIDAGIGLQDQIGDPVVAPGEIPITQEQLDQYNMTPGSNVIPTDPRTMLPQIPAPEEFKFPMGGGADLGTLEASPQPIDPLGMLPQLQDVVTQKDVDEPETFLQKIGLGDLDVKKAAVMAALNTAVGKPVSFVIQALKATLPEQDPRVGIIDDLYTRDDIGRVAPGELMAGYNPISGGFLNTITGGRLGTPTQYGLQDAYQERIDTIEESLNKFDKYDVTSPNFDPVATKQQTDKLEKLRADKKAEADALGITAAEDKRIAEAKMKQTIADAEAGIPISGVDQGAVELGDMDATAPTKQLTSTDLPYDTEFEDMADVENIGLSSRADINTTDKFIVPFEGARTVIENPNYIEPGGTILEDDFGLDQVFDKSEPPKDDDKPAPSFDPGQGFVDQGGEGEFGGAPSAPVSTAGQAGPPSQRGGGGGGEGGGGGGGGCVIATHAVNSGAFTKDTKREAVRWCVKNLHRTWWGEAVRRGYRYYGQKAIDEGNAKNHYQEFKDYVAFGTGKRRTLKTAWTFVYRTVQFFIKGLFNAKR